MLFVVSVHLLFGDDGLSLEDALSEEEVLVGEGCYLLCILLFDVGRGGLAKVHSTGILEAFDQTSVLCLHFSIMEDILGCFNSAPHVPG